MGDPAVQSRIQELEGRVKGRKVIIGVDRLDYTKGLPEKFKGYKTFLERHPEWRDKVLLIQIAIPSREDVGAYQHLKAQVNELVGQVNGEFCESRSGSPRAMCSIADRCQRLLMDLRCFISTARFNLKS